MGQTEITLEKTKANRQSYKDHVKTLKYVEAHMDEYKEMTQQEIAASVSSGMGIQVTVQHIQSVAKSLEIQLGYYPRKPVDPESAQRTLALHIAALYHHLGLGQKPELMEIAGL